MVLAKQPGLFVKSESAPVEPTLRLHSTGVTGFVGITERGPLQQAIRISSFEGFQSIFGGFNCPGFLPYAIYGFFNAGGVECVVVRTAGQTGQAGVCCSEFQINTLAHQPLAKFVAISPGNWGNNITAKLWYSVVNRFEAIQTDSLGRSFSVNSDIQVRPLMVLRIQAEGHVYYRRVKKVTSSRVMLDREIKNLSRYSGEGVKLEILNFNCAFSDGKIHESFLLLSSNSQDDNYFVNIINSRSKLVRVANVDRVDGFPEEVSFRAFSKGRDGILDIKPADFIGEYSGNISGRGLGILEGIDDVNVLAIPDSQIFFHLSLMSKEQALEAIYSVQMAMIGHCEKLRQRFAILDVPNFAEAVESSFWNRRFDSMNAASYYPFVEMIDPADRRGVDTVVVPPSGHIAGSMQKIDRTKGQIQSPANVYLPGVVGLSCVLEEGELDFLYSDRVNVLKSIPGRGVKVWGARTLSSENDWKFISIRRTFGLISEALREGTSWAVYETNNFALRKRLIRSVSGFLVNLWRDGYLAGKTAEEAFFVRCDEELNPPENIDVGILTIVVGLALAKPTEFIVIQLAAERESSNVVVNEQLL